MQQKIAGFVMELDYFGTASRNLYLQTDVNRFAGDEIINQGNQARLNQSFGTVEYGRSIGIANSNVGAFGLSRHFSKGWTAHAIYTWGKALDLTSNNDNGVGGDGSAEGVFDADNVTTQYGRSDYDSRQRFSGDAVWSVPGVKTGIGHLITSGWTLSPIIILQSGQPFTVYTSKQFTYGPDYASGGDYNADGFGYDLPNTPRFGNHIKTHRSDFQNGLFQASDFPVPAEGTEGNLGRNTFDGPGFANVNLSAERSFDLPRLGDAAKLQIRGEIFNLFNRVNLVQPVNDLSNSLFGVSENQDAARDIQVSAHIRF
jgi:hypothetical protein